LIAGLGLGAAMVGGLYLRQSSQPAPVIDWANSKAHEVLVASKGTVPEIPEGDYFDRVAEILDKTFVNEIKDQQVLAVGAIRGMVNSLGDPHSIFMPKEQFDVFLRNQSGEFEGIGAEVRFKWDEAALAKYRAKQPVEGADLVPDLVISALAPDSPAEKAGLKIGDRIDEVNGRWLLTGTKMKQFRTDLDNLRKSKLAPAEMDKQMRTLFDGMRDGISAQRGREAVSTGTKGEVKLTWVSGGKATTKSLTKGKFAWPAVVKSGEDTQFRLFTGASEALKEHFKGASEIKLDLRNSTQGNFDEVGKVLNLLVPKGTYGVIAHEDGDVQQTLASEGPGAPVKVTLTVDSTTRGAAELLVLALKGRPNIQIVGGETAGERAMVRTSMLPDGSGYTLTMGTYFAKPPAINDPNKPKKVAMLEEETK